MGVLLGFFLEGGVYVFYAQILVIVVKGQLLILTQILYFLQNLYLLRHLSMESLDRLFCTCLNLLECLRYFLNLFFLFSKLLFLLLDYLLNSEFFIFFALGFIFLELFLHLFQDFLHLRFLVLDFLNYLGCDFSFLLQFVHLTVSFIDEVLS